MARKYKKFKFLRPSNRHKGELALGNIIYEKKFSDRRSVNYISKYLFRLPKSQLGNLLLIGDRNSEKTKLIQHFVRQYDDSSVRFLIFDTTNEWRHFLKDEFKESLTIHSLTRKGESDFALNLLRIPKFIRPFEYYLILLGFFTHSYQLPNQLTVETRIGKVLYQLYDEYGVFDSEENNENDNYHAWEQSKDITLLDLYQRLFETFDDEMRQDLVLNDYLERLSPYGDSLSDEAIHFCRRGGKSVDMLLHHTGVSLIDASGLSSYSERFFYTVLVNSIFKQAQRMNGYVKETVFITEYAHRYFMGPYDERDDFNTYFRRVFEFSKSFNLSHWLLMETIHSVPRYVVNNTDTVLMSRNSSLSDIERLNSFLLESYNYYDRDLEYYLPKLSTGEFIVKMMKEKTDPILIKVNCEIDDGLSEKHELQAYFSD